MAASLDDLLAYLPDNSTGEISAADLRTVVTGLWGRVIVGGLTSDGELVGAPTSWSAVMIEGGLYTVTHQLGTPDYAVIITPLAKSLDGVSPAVEATDATSFTFGLYSAAHQGLHGCYTNFVVVLK